jgi:hypothetical protein
MRLFLSLTTYALLFYGITSLPFDISGNGSIDWTGIVIIGISALMGGTFIGYYAKEWGWVLASLLEPLWTICVFPCSPIVFTFLSASGEIGSIRGRYIDFPALIFSQLIPGIILGFIGGILGEILGSVSNRRQQEKEIEK